MAKKDYSEDLLIQAPTAELLEKQLGWACVFAQDHEDFGPDSLLGRASDREVVLTLEVLAALKRLNPGLPEVAYSDALAQVALEDIAALIITSASSLMPPRASNKVAGLGAVDVGAVLAVEKRAR